MSDPAMEGELHERPLYRRFVGLEGAARMPDETTILRFGEIRHGDRIVGSPPQADLCGRS